MYRRCIPSSSLAGTELLPRITPVSTEGAVWDTSHNSYELRGPDASMLDVDTSTGAITTKFDGFALTRQSAGLSAGVVELAIVGNGWSDLVNVMLMNQAGGCIEDTATAVGEQHNASRVSFLSSSCSPCEP